MIDKNSDPERFTINVLLAPYCVPIFLEKQRFYSKLCKNTLLDIIKKKNYQKAIFNTLAARVRGWVIIIQLNANYFNVILKKKKRVPASKIRTSLTYLLWETQTQPTRWTLLQVFRAYEWITILARLWVFE